MIHLFLFTMSLFSTHIHPLHAMTAYESGGAKPLPDSVELTSAFPTARIYVNIREELPPGTPILDLSTHPAVQSMLTHSDGLLGHDTQLRYRMINTLDNRLLRVSPTTGQVSVATRLDREALCASRRAQFCCNARAQIPTTLLTDSKWSGDSRVMMNLPKSQLCHLVTHISLQPNRVPTVESPNHTPNNQANRLALIYLYIRIADINDHTPQFHSQSSTVNVMEDTPPGNVLHYFRITDPDAGANGLREVHMKATPLSANKIQQQSTMNNAASEMMKTSVEANTVPVELNPFEVKLTKDGASLILRRELDRETVPAYDITLIASDGDTMKPRSSQLSMRLHVTDANDNPPVWVKQRSRGSSINIPMDSVHFTPTTDPASPQQFNVSITEDTQVGSLIYWLQARDADIGDNARLQYMIDTTAPGGLAAMDYFTVQATTGEVRLRTELDYESASAVASRPVIEVPVLVHDCPRSGRQLSARATLFIQILDVNDVHPIIVASPLSPPPLIRSYPLVDGSGSVMVFGIWENQPAGQPVASILVSDPDTGDGGKVSCTVKNDYFRLTGESVKLDYGMIDAQLNMDPSAMMSGTGTGPSAYQLISTQSLDREQIPRHQVLLTCRDHDPSRSLASTRRLDIDVLDENDNVPQFADTLITLNCAENAPPGQLIGRLTATDRDMGDNARLRFWIDETSTSWVSVNEKSGEVRVNTIFDREKEEERQFIAYVADAGRESHTASVQVKIHITDENDHSPRFTDLYFFTLPENSLPGTEVGQIHVEDEDAGDNGKVHYLLRNPSQEFELNKSTGMLTVRSIRFEGLSHLDKTKKLPTFLDREIQDTYELNVIAEDGGDPPRRSTTVVHIGLSDVNDHAPQFRYPTPHGPGSVLNVSCAQLSSQVIARVHANDSDAGRNGELQYSIVRTPSIRSRTKRAVESKNTSSVPDESVSDPSKVTTDKPLTTTSLPVKNESNSPPSPNSRHIKSTATVEFLPGGPTPDHFEINSYNGQLFLIHPILDCTQPANVRLLIRAEDGGTPALSSTAMLTIHVHPTQRELRGYNPKGGSSSLDQSLQPGSTRHRSYSNRWTGRTVDRAAAASRSGDSSTYPTSMDGTNASLFGGSSHWSAILGLVIAMVILVLLLCLTLVILRRRYAQEDRKTRSKKDNHLHHTRDQSLVGTTGRPPDGSSGTGTLFYKDPQIGHSLHELASNSPHQRSLSPTTMTQVDDLNCSSVTLELNSPNLLNTHYFCAMPASSTAMTLNSGEVALLHREGKLLQTSGEVHTVENPLGYNMSTSPGPMIYKDANGDLYGYMEPPMRNCQGGRGQKHTYQTLQPNQRVSHPDSFTADQCRRYTTNTFRKQTADCPRRNNVLVMDNYTGTARTSQYTPLFEVDGERGKNNNLCLLQASQPDLSGKSASGQVGQTNPLPRDKPSQKFERPLSMTDLVQVMPNGDPGEVENPVQMNQMDRFGTSRPDCRGVQQQQQHASPAKRKSQTPIYKPTSVQPRTSNQEPLSRGPVAAYNTASFV